MKEGSASIQDILARRHIVDLLYFRLINPGQYTYYTVLFYSPCKAALGLIILLHIYTPHYHAKNKYPLL